jgi:integrase
VRKNIVTRKMIYTIIAMNQLRNGCRISESVRAFIRYYKDKKFSKKVVVKISKSDAAKTNKHGDRIIPKTRYRNIVFQEWCEVEKLKEQIFETMKGIPFERLRQRVLDYLLKNFQFNTHSLRYARVNYLLSSGKDVTTVAKYIGHADVKTILHYCQQKNVDKMDDIDE